MYLVRSDVVPMQVSDTFHYMIKNADFLKAYYFSKVNKIKILKEKTIINAIAKLLLQVTKEGQKWKGRMKN